MDRLYLGRALLDSLLLSSANWQLDLIDLAV